MTNTCLLYCIEQCRHILYMLSHSFSSLVTDLTDLAECVRVDLSFCFTPTRLLWGPDCGHPNEIH